MIAILIVLFPIFTFAATASDITDQPSTHEAGVGANHKIWLTLASVISEGSTLSLVFPSGFDLASITEDDVDIADDDIDLTTASDCSGSEQISVAISGQTVSFSVCAGDGGAMSSGSVVAIEIGTNAASSGLGTNQIINPSAVATYFINITETGGNSGTIVYVTTSTGSSSVSATVPASTAPGGGGGSTGGSAPTSDPAPDPDPVPVPDPEVVPDPTPTPTPTPTPGPTPDPVPAPDGTPAPDSVPDSDSSDVPPAGGTASSTPEVSVDESSSESADTAVPDDQIAPEDIPINPDEIVVEPDEVTVPVDEEVSEVIEPPVVSVTTSNLQRVVNVVQETLQEIRRQPEAQVAVDIAIPVAIVATATTAAALTTSFSLLPFLQYIFTSPFLFFARRKRKSFGIVYNAITKVGIGLASVRLYDVATKRLVKSAITNAKGQYFFVTNPGKYYLTVAKNGFVFPSAYLANTKDDGIYLDVYSGQEIEVTERDATIAANIPLDLSQNIDAQVPSQIRRKIIWRKVHHAISIVGILLATGVFVILPSWFAAGLVMLQICAFALFWKLALPRKPRGWGVVYDAKTKRPVGNAVVRLFEPKYNKLVETVLTDALGRYSFLVGPNEYFVSANSAGYKENIIRPIDYTKKQEPEPLAIDVALESTKPV